MDSRRSAVLQSRYTGSGSPWEKAKARAAQYQSTALGNLPTEIAALKEDYSRPPNFVDSSFTDSRQVVQDISKLPPSIYHPSAVTDNEKKCDQSTLSNQEPYPPSDPVLNKGHNVLSNTRSQWKQRDYNYSCILPPSGVQNKITCPETENSAQKPVYDFLRQTPGITKNNMNLPPMSMKEPVNFELSIPRPADSMYHSPPAQTHLRKSDYTPTMPSVEGRIGVEHSLNKSLYSRSGAPTPTLAGQPNIDDIKSSPTSQETTYPKDILPSNKEILPMQHPQTSSEIQSNLPLMQSPPGTDQNPKLQVGEKSLPTDVLESMALKGLKRIRTTNQTYGSWIGDPFLEGRDWYRSPRYPHVKTYLTKHREQAGSWM